MNITIGEMDAGIVFRPIGERRSIREYTGREVPEEVIRRIIGAGVQAPTGLAIQPWKFVVVRDKALMREVSEYCKAALLEKSRGITDETVQRFLSLLSQEGFNIFYNAPVLIAVLGAASDDMSAIDCTLCAENMMLAAWALGIGSCWVGAATLVEQNPGLRAALKVPDDHQVVAPLIFGYPAPLPPKPARREPRIAWVP